MNTQAGQYIIGIDGGGSGCRVAIATPQMSILAITSGGPANPATDPDAAVSNLTTALETARQQATLAPADIAAARAYVGLAGVQDAVSARRIRDALPIDAPIVSEDRAATLAGALGDRPGSLAALGTGSFVAHLARPGAGPRFVGGWGLQIGDQASGAWLGRALLTQALLAAEGVAETTPLLRQALGDFASDASQLAAFARAASPAAFARYAPRIVAAAGAADPAGCSLMQAGVDYLVSALRSLGHRDSDPLCLTGGLGPHYAPFLPADLRANLQPPRGSALDGALFLAARQQAPA